MGIAELKNTKLARSTSEVLSLHCRAIGTFCPVRESLPLCLRFVEWWLLVIAAVIHLPQLGNRRGPGSATLVTVTVRQPLLLP